MKRSTPFIALALTGLLAQAAASDPSGSCKVRLTHDPLVMRVGKDEFRVAFGLDGSACGDSGCAGTIRYKATWRSDDGVSQTAQRAVSYAIPEGAPRSLTVDRSYFDDGVAHHTTEIVNVDVAQISCEPATADVARR
jgi:hypothetical protein